MSIVNSKIGTDIHPFNCKKMYTNQRTFAIISLGFILAMPYSSSSQIVYHDSIAPTFQFSQCVNCETNTIDPSKHLLLEFWASWCKGCLSTIPQINKITQEYKNDITVVSVNSFDSLHVIKHLIKKENIESLVVHDFDQKIHEGFSITLLPVCILIDKYGKIRWRGYPNSLTNELLDEFIRADTVILDDPNNYKIEGDFSIKTTGLIKKYYLKSSMHIYNNESESNSTISYNTDHGIELSAKNYPSSKIVEFFIKLKYKNKHKIKINSEKSKNIDFYLKYETKQNSDVIMDILLNKLMTTYKLDTSITIENIDFLELVHSAELLDHRSRNQASLKHIEQHPNGAISLHQYTLCDLSDILSETLGVNVVCPSTSAKKYDFKLSNIGNAESVKNELGSSYGVYMKSKQGKSKVIEIVDK